MASCRFVVFSLVLQAEVLALVSYSEVDAAQAFASFVQQYHREYEVGSEEYRRRRAIYERRAREVEAHNARPRRMWSAGLSQLSDRTDEELNRLRGWHGVAGHDSVVRGASVARHISGSMSLRQTSRSKSLPDEVSWAHLNALSRLRKQRRCGSCWAMAVTTVLDANYEIHQRTDKAFSAQELVDCVPNAWHCGGEGGCHGATVEQALDYALKHGLGEVSEVPYLGREAVCSKDLAAFGDSRATSIDEMFRAGLHTATEASLGASAFGLMGWERLPRNQYEPLLAAVVERGPVAVSVAAKGWHPYRGGIFDSCEIDAVINHSVTLIGYGLDVGLQEKFWTIQNSWSDSWGEGGRIRILRRDSDETECGTDHQPENGIECDGGLTEVRVCGMCGVLYDPVVAHFADAEE